MKRVKIKKICMLRIEVLIDVSCDELISMYLIKLLICLVEDYLIQVSRFGSKLELITVYTLFIAFASLMICAFLRLVSLKLLFLL